MDSQAKATVLQEAQSHIAAVRSATTEEMHKTSEHIERYRQAGNDPVAQRLFSHFSGRLDELHHLFPNPYFVRCDVSSAEGGDQTLRFGKFAFIEQAIFSWTSPAATLRFADIGPITYESHEGKMWSGTLSRKDQLMISGGNIVFMTSESSKYERTLVYQEQLSRRKSGFILPEIVARMERAQDDVIRAGYKGSYLISGPAGSGKTTLAFHRIAYLLQSPDTAQIFSQENVITFVQDEGTRAYFSQLLPELGIHNVLVTTFATWAFERLGLTDVGYAQRANGIDDVIDSYEFHKLSVLRSVPGSSKGKSIFQTLRDVYVSKMDENDLALFAQQERDRVLDRYDLTVLLNIERGIGGFTKEEEYFEQKKNFRVQRHCQTVPLKYSLVVVDEVQNYLPEQIALLRSCIDESTQGMLYVGDLAQQIFLGTMRNWDDAGETLSDDRKVVLDRVYRSTKQIMRYIHNIGFPVSVPEELRDGADVVEVEIAKTEEQITWIREHIAKQKPEVQIGILSFSADTLSAFSQAFTSHPNIHVLAIHQAQGVEFDVVYVVGPDLDISASVSEEMNNSLASERAKIQKDLLYVALTRAMDQLCVVSGGRES